MSRIPAQVQAQLGGRSWDLDATLERGPDDDGVLYATGNENAGLALFVKDGHLVFDYNSFGTHHEVVSPQPLPTGPVVVGVRFRRDAEGNGGRAALVVEGEEVGAVAVDFVMRIISSSGSSVGYGHGSPVSPRYDGRFPFTGTLDRIDIALVRPGSAEDTAAAEADERSTMGRQ
jgi:arylsulfatase